MTGLVIITGIMVPEAVWEAATSSRRSSWSPSVRVLLW